MYTVRVWIDRPIDQVWDYFTNPDNWMGWYGKNKQSGSGVSESKAPIYWLLGEQAVIERILKGREIRVTGTRSDTNFRFQKAGPQTTIVEVVQKDPQANEVSDKVILSNKPAWEQKLSTLKRQIESEKVF